MQSKRKQIYDYYAALAAAVFLAFCLVIVMYPVWVDIAREAWECAGKLSVGTRFVLGVAAMITGIVIWIGWEVKQASLVDSRENIVEGRK